jgi:hypothetical protein
MYRQAALFLTNKENLVASTGDFMGTVINSDRQLWSVAGNLAVVYRVFFGMNFDSDQLIFKPFVPKAWGGDKTLTGIKYGKATLNITLKGYGSKVKNMTLNGKKLNIPEIYNTLQGEQNIVIELDNQEVPAGKINMVANAFSPETPRLEMADRLSWNEIKGVAEYHVYRNGAKISTTKQAVYDAFEGEGEYQVLSVDAEGRESFLSEPVRIISPAKVQTQLMQRKTGEVLEQKIKVNADGLYHIDFYYANGNGPINTENKCAIRTLLIDGKPVGKIVMPQRGSNDWLSKGYTNALPMQLTAGEHNISLQLTFTDKNMNEANINEAYIESLRIVQR